MKKTAVFVLGPDRPGIIASVAKALFEQGCNLEDVSQTILQSQFVGIFIATLPDTLEAEDLLTSLWDTLDPLGLFVHLTLLKKPVVLPHPPGEPFVITTIGPDKPGLVAGVTDVLARHEVNITNLKAVFRGDEQHPEYFMIYEVEVPLSVEHDVFRTALYERAQALGLEINLQHREIFEQLHRV
jgi:glycine cleavage system transcriptional repressor